MLRCCWAQDVESFYSERTVTIIVGSGPGGITDISARIIGEFLERHLPGEPTVIVQNMPGGGSVTMANHVYRSAARDGTVLGYPVPGMITAELLEPNRARYEGRRLNWIGTAFRATNTIAVLDTFVPSIGTHGCVIFDGLVRHFLVAIAAGPGRHELHVDAFVREIAFLEGDMVWQRKDGVVDFNLYR